MEDLKDLLHAYVPESDYKLQSPNESDKCYIFLNMSLFVTLIVGLLLFGLFCKLKHRWLVNAKCAFCNCVVRVWKAKLYWWFCQNCQRINGYSKNLPVRTDFSSLEDSQEHKNDSVLLNSPDVGNNKVQSLSNQRKRIAYSKNDLNESSIISHSPKVFHDKGNEPIFNAENHAQSETSFYRIRNKMKGFLRLHDHDTEQLSNNTENACSDHPNSNSTRLPAEVSNLRKMHTKLILDDINRRFELLNAEKMLCAKTRQMRKLDKSLRDVKRNTSFVTPHSISRRNTYFERPIHHAIVCSASVLNNDTAVELRNVVATGRLATLETHLAELRDMQENEIKLLKSQIENKSKMISKIEGLKFGVVDFYEKGQLNCNERPFQSNFLQELQSERQSQISFSSKNNNNSESGYLSQSCDTRTKNQLELNNNEMSVITEEDNNNPDKLNQDNKQAAATSSGISIASQRRHSGGGGGRSAAPMVKPTRSGQRPAIAAAKVPILSSSSSSAPQ